MSEGSSTHRTQDVFERIGEVRLGTTIPLAPISSAEARRRYGVGPGWLSDLVFRVGFELSGFGRFTRMPAEELEPLLDRTDFRDFYAPLAVSATLVLADDPSRRKMVERAASLIDATRRYRDDLFAGRIEQDVSRGQPLEMGLYPNMFSTSLEFLGGAFVLRKRPDLDRVGVLCRSNAYVVDFSGTDADIGRIIATLEQILADSEPATTDPVPGVVTAAAPDSGGAAAFEALLDSPVNAASVGMLADCSFVVCLEPDQSPTELADVAFLTHVGDLDNRWFHSTLQLVVFDGGSAAALCNFRSWLDGNAMVRGAATIQSSARATFTPSVADPLEFVRLDWETEGLDLGAVRADVERRTSDDVPFSVHMEGVGRHLLRAPGLSPVMVFTLAVAVAATRLSGRVPNMYQAATMADRRGVGVEFASVTTPAVVDFVVALVSGREAEATSLLRPAVESQMAELDAVRSELQFETQLLLFHQGTHRYRHRWSHRIEQLTIKALARLGAWQRSDADIRMSHPTIRDELSYLGRPGARMHQSAMFSLHYQLAPDAANMTIAPGLDWSVGTAEFWETLRQAVDDVGAIVRAGQSA